MSPIEWLLVIWVCGSGPDAQCHYERMGHYRTHEACTRAADHSPWFKCVMQEGRRVGS